MPNESTAIGLLKAITAERQGVIHQGNSAAATWHDSDGTRVHVFDAGDHYTIEHLYAGHQTWEVYSHIRKSEDQAPVIAGSRQALGWT